jgi:hypothetical protein
MVEFGFTGLDLPEGRKQKAESRKQKSEDRKPI